MKADTVELLGLFDRDIRYLIPIFQRNYKWNRDSHWAPLWLDVRGVAEEILANGEGPDLGDHFLGAIVCEQQESFGRDALALSVIDGQQRLTTLQLLIAGVLRTCRRRTMTDEDYLKGLLENKPSVVKERTPHRYKVWPNVADRDGYLSAMEDGEGSSRPEEAVRFFASAVDAWLDEGDPDDPLDDADHSPDERLDALITAMTRHLRIVKIDLEPTDDAQLIFETLNGRGERLTDADLIRNHLFRQADEEGADTEELHRRYWQPFDLPEWSAPVVHGRHQRERIHMLLNHWLSMRRLEDVPAAAIFREFKDHLRRSDSAATVAADIAEYREVFSSFDRFPPDSREWWFFRRLAEMDLITVYPVLLSLFGWGDEIPVTRRTRALEAIESFLVRRLIGRESTRSYGAVFGEVLRAAAGGTPEDADARIVRLLAAKTAEADRWPDDDVVRSVVLNTNVYRLKQSRLRMVLEGLERELASDGNTETVTLGHNIWIEHLLPQGWRSVPEWALPDDATDPTQAALDRDHALHTLGNLTLTTSYLDIRLSNRAWPEKVDGLQASALRLNTEVCMSFGAAPWDERSIRSRGSRLADLVIQVWPGPQTMLAEIGDRGA